MAKTPEIDLRENYGKNYIINGNFDFWQRGTSIQTTAAAKKYTADRFFVQISTGAGAGATISRSTDVPDIYSKYSMKFQRDSGNTNTSVHRIRQPIEYVNLRPIVGKYVTFSFWAKKGANYSEATSILLAQIITGTVENEEPSAGYTGQAIPLSENVTLTTSWQKFTISGFIDSNVKAANINLRYSPTGTAGADDSFYLSQVMVTEGLETDLPFRLFGEGVDAELAACQRYYQFYDNVGVRQFTTAAGQFVVQTTYYNTSMRIAPTITKTSLNTAQYNLSSEASDENRYRIDVESTGAGSTSRYLFDLELEAEL